MFKNDDIVCIDKSLKQFTYGKRYKIFTIEKTDAKYCDVLYIFNDKHKLEECFDNSFISFKKYRNLKLKKINENR